MSNVSIISDTLESAELIGRKLKKFFVPLCFDRHGMPSTKPDQHTVVDIDLGDVSGLSDVRRWLKRRPVKGKVIFAVERGVRHQEVQAYAMGATELISRPIDRDLLLARLLEDDKPSSVETAIPPVEDGIASGIDVLQAMFSAVSSGAAPDLASVDRAGEKIASHIRSNGLARWIDTVRQHHSQTYQHCLLVTGLAVTFGRNLGFGSGDQKKLAVAGLLHDVGKAGIPLEILEKPGPLDAGEIAIMREHPVLGADALRSAKGLDPQMLDMVLHHHEYLDGSGYPHGLQANEIADLVRIMTIADVFGALIERRSYKAPLLGEAAYDILKSMGPKLDRDLVREFRPIVAANAH